MNSDSKSFFLSVQKFFYTLLVFVHVIIGENPQLNLYYTDWKNPHENEGNYTWQHNCLRVIPDIFIEDEPWEMIFYCMSEFSTKFNIVNDDLFPKFTFDELSKQNITSEDLYFWSAPIDVIEHYQDYLNQISSSNNSLLAKEVFYNCTLPRFGPLCQYEFPTGYLYQSSLNNIIYLYYQNYVTQSTNNVTCYMLIECNRGPYPACLDWSEVCDGKIDCLDDGLDEKDCWQLELNQCQDNEFRCMNGQCIPRSFFQETYPQIDCLDATDRFRGFLPSPKYTCYSPIPSFDCDDTQCDYTHLTSSCLDIRETLLLEKVFSIKDSSISDECWSALIYFFNITYSNDLSCEEDQCIKTIRYNCSKMFYFPNVPVFFGDIYFAFRKNDSSYLTTEDIGLLYICYNNSYYDTIFNMFSTISFNDTKCFLHETISYPLSWSYLWKITPDTPLQNLYNWLKKYQFLYNYTSTFCNQSNMYPCMNSSKCISIHRLMDNIYDCPYMDDEDQLAMTNTHIIEQFKQSHYKCQTSNKYIHQIFLQDNQCDCEDLQQDECQDERRNSFDYRKDISFQTICDGYVELTPRNINGRNETDETECEQWECNNIYTNCDSIWNCRNGADEIGCSSLIQIPINCLSNEHICVSPITNQFICLSIDEVNDGRIDCLGAYDEPSFCRSELMQNTDEKFYCTNNMSHLCLDDSRLCDGYNHCDNEEDEQFCSTNETVTINDGLCRFYNSLSMSEKFLCDFTFGRYKQTEIIFYIGKSDIIDTYVLKNLENQIDTSLSVGEMSNQYQSRCHRGLDVRVWIDDTNNLTADTCLCPLSFYGDQCQYQNQRVSLTIQFRSLSDSWQTVFAIVISLIDDSYERIIHSYEQLTYLWLSNCQTRYNIYLVYSHRPKNLTHNYYIHIDIYEKMSLKYRGSLLYPVTFLFLPIQRIGLFVDIPRHDDDESRSCSNVKCNNHGRCIKYANNPENESFCKCDEGWSGKYCTIQHTCQCANGSLCVGIGMNNNRSICVCSLHKFGSRCLLTDRTCEQNDNNSICLNDGQCVSNGGYNALYKKFVCICKEGFSGDRCGIADNQLILSFNKDIIVSQTIFIHFINIIYLDRLIRSTTFRTIPVIFDSVLIYRSQPFHLVFVELTSKHYYLAILQHNFNQSTTITKMINPSDRCLNISELFNETFLEWDLIRRIKYYHLPCQNSSFNLSCFYDEVHFCLCYQFDQKRLANCFRFDHNMTFNCLGKSECENDGQCFQDKPDCPTRSICMCPACYFGRRCQFNTKGFGLSLDVILGYHILQNVPITQQTFIVKFSLALTIILMIAGFIDSILCLMTFKNKTAREVGCGLYLLGSSLTTLFTMIVFGLKFIILLLAQITMIKNELVLQIQCHSLDFVLRICLYMDQWLNACVAIERVYTVIKGVQFNKNQSKKMAKFVIIIVFFIVIGTCLHDPIHRRLIDEKTDDNHNDDVRRVWCIVRYPTGFQHYDYIIHILHFSGPFMLNFLSSIVLIVQQSFQQTKLHKERPYRQILQEQFYQHKHLLIAPIVMITLGVPRLIIVFITKCMKSANDYWLFLIGYFISFIPTMLTFIVFVLPSKFYKREFRKTVAQYRTNIQRFFHSAS